MASTPTDKTTGTAETPAPSVAKVLAALHRLGEATAAAIATEAGLGYSTTTPKLRSLETAGLAEPTRSDTGRSLWRLTDTGRAQVEEADDHSQPEGQPTPDAAADAPRGTHGDDPQDAGQDHDQRQAVADPADRPPATAPGSGPPDPGAAEPAPGEATLSDNTEDSRPRAEPEELVTATHADAPAEVPTADEPSDTAADDPADNTTGDPTAEGTFSASVGQAVGGPAGTRRASGTLRGAILDILEANPGKQYKVSELCRLIDRANEGTDAKKASAGAVHNAAVKLVGTGRAVMAAEKPATFALTDPTT
ncbi:MarR family transcriptional regulator [Micromonospora sp. NPDC048871]|uniref:MarR family transcriptional regulator n=1 Tax=Micromonospora sp. NPDC048871 TaxID=3364259 RepID=UPI003720A485